MIHCTRRTACSLTVAVPTFVVMLLVMAMSATAPAAEEKPKSADNAALKYWQAFGLMPRLEVDQAKIIDEWKTVPLDAAALKVIESGKDALLYLHRASQLPRCDWELDMDDGPGLLMPHLGKARELSKLACLRARYHFDEGRHRAGVDDIVATLVMARHVGSDSVLISILVQFAIERTAIDMAAAYLPKLDAASLKHLAASLEKLPAGGTIKDSLRVEREYMLNWFIKQLREKGKIGPPVYGLFDAAKTLEAVVAAAGGPKGAIAQLKELEPIYDDVGKLLALPREQQLKELAELRKKADKNPFAKLLLPAYDKVLDAEAYNRAYLAMFKAAIAVVQDGPDKLKSIPDPFGTGPFEYSALPQGFELKSKLTTLKDGQITLKVGVSQLK